MTPEELQERDVIEFSDDDGNTMMLEVMDYFYYNGQEFAILCNAEENPSDDDPDDDPQAGLGGSPTFPSVLRVISSPCRTECPPPSVRGIFCS